jgi:hypothetical protein
MDEEKLQGPIRELQAFARTARRDALMSNSPYEVLLLNNAYTLRPVADSKDAARAPLTYGLPSGVSYAIKHASDKEFKKQADARWVFLPNGLCEPITFLFQRGKDWVRLRADPLTAGSRKKNPLSSRGKGDELFKAG